MTAAPVLRRGLPRVRGGAPWPGGSAEPAGVPERAPAGGEPPMAEVRAPAAPAPAPARAPLPDRVRRGLPRVSGGEPWPVSSAAVVAAVVEDVVPVAPTPVALEPVPAAAPAPAPAETVGARIRRLSMRQRAGLGIGAGLSALALAGLVVLAARGLYTFAAFRDFVATYPGEYELPASAHVGVPAWLGWQHAFNAFLIVLIVRSGLQVRRERRPAAHFTPRGRGGRRISIMLWLHQSLDVLWLANGAVFVVLLSVTGQWMRIVPTSWSVFPNALSAMVQYLTLDWPTENGWVNYNSLQQLAYFATVFIAAPLAAATGIRMSAAWPAGAARLNRLYPVEWARRVHFPVMLYFVAFIVVHVVLVLATGALRNLNHMYAAQGSTDPDAFADNWVGLGLFALSLLLTAAGLAAARPTVLAPIARLFGTVSR